MGNNPSKHRLRIPAVEPFRVFAVLLMALGVLDAHGQAEEIRSQMNGKKVMSDDGDGGYTFLAAGHLYGAPNNHHSVMPASTILANLEQINQSGAKFFVALGDNFRRADSRQIANFKAHFSDRLVMPLFNAVGNHDVTERGVYEKAFGETTYHHFYHRTELFVFLDTEFDVGRISGEQLEYLKQLVDEAVNRQLSRVFIFSHKLLWAVDPEYTVVLDNVNPSVYPTAEPFRANLAPLVRRLAESCEVYWVSGDVGCNDSLPLFYERDKATDATFIAIGIGEKPSDAMLQFHIPANHNEAVQITPLPLAGDNFANVESYGCERWESHYGKDHNHRSKLSNRIRRVALSKYFWLGIGTGIMTVGSVLLTRKGGMVAQ